MNGSSWPRRVTVAVGVSALALVVLLGLRALASLLLLFFGGVVAAAFLRAIVVWLHERTQMRESLALALTIALLLALSVGAGFLLVPRIAEQLASAPLQLERVRESVDRLTAEPEWLARLWTQLRSDMVSMAGEDMFARAFGVVSSALGILASVALLMFVSVYLALSPRDYLTTALQLVPMAHRDRVEHALLSSGVVLQRWIVGRIMSMTIVGVGTAVGLWIIGAQLALSLGFLAGILSFVPYVGPVLSAVPAVVLAIPQGFQQVAWVGVVYGGVQLAESYVVTPQIQQRAVRIAPAYLLLAQSAMGLLVGALGFLLATPLVACLTVLVRELYVEHALQGDVSGEREPEPR